MSMNLDVCVFGYLCRLAVLLGLCWVLGSEFVQSATHAGGQMLWCSARRACVGFTSHVVVLPAHCRGVVGCVAPVLWQCMFLQVSSASNSPSYNHRRQRREGSWRSR